MPRCLVVIALALTIGTVACGGGGGGGTPSSRSVSPPSTGLPSAPVPNAPIAVNVVAGTVTSSVDIITGAPAISPVVNATTLGIGNTATNVGTTVSRDVIPHTVILFGPGLSGSMTVTISGPANEIPISNIRTIKATDNTPGIAFDVSIPVTAALGARTVTLQNPNGDITTFTGGLEIVP